jgi:hypothetical protein
MKKIYEFIFSEDFVDLLIVITILAIFGVIMYTIFYWNHDLHQNIDKGLIRLN